MTWDELWLRPPPGQLHWRRLSAEAVAAAVAVAAIVEVGCTWRRLHSSLRRKVLVVPETGRMID